MPGRSIRDDSGIEFLLKAVLELRNVDEAYDFFNDLCTVTELKTMAQRLIVAKMLSSKCVYSEIARTTGASTATISRVNRSLNYGENGYDVVFERLAEKGEI